jgi:hypothetical protein
MTISETLKQVMDIPLRPLVKVNMSEPITPFSINGKAIMRLDGQLPWVFSSCATTAPLYLEEYSWVSIRRLIV